MQYTNDSSQEGGRNRVVRLWGGDCVSESVCDTTNCMSFTRSIFLLHSNWVM